MYCVQAIRFFAKLPRKNLESTSPEILRQEWREYRLSMEAVLNEVKHLHSLGLTVDEAIERARFGRFASWSGAGSQGPIGIRRIYAELNGELD